MVAILFKDLIVYSPTEEFRMRHARTHLSTALLLGLTALAGCGGNSGRGSNGSAGVSRLSGAGATFVDPIVQKWSQVYKDKSGVLINYGGGGSGAGIKQVIAGTVDFGCSDAPMTQEDVEAMRAAGGEPVHIPLVMGAVVACYNLPNLDAPLVLSGPLLADIFMGKIKKWNDPKIAALNASAKLPDLEIVPVRRSDPSGTTNIFSEYLAKVSPEFNSSIGVSKMPKWPQGLGIAQKGNNLVAGHVKKTEGAIGYTELFYAEQNKIAYASMLNAAGKVVVAEHAAVTAAAETALDAPKTEEPYTLHELAFSLANSPGDKAYPICGISYCIFNEKNANRPELAATVAFLKWATQEGQAYSNGLGYAELSPKLVEKIHARLAQVDTGKGDKAKVDAAKDDKAKADAAK